MSYCRFTEGDVYLYADVAGGITCCMCSIGEDAVGPGMNVNVPNAHEAIVHLDVHRAAGESVPDSAYAELNDDILAGRTFEPGHVD